METIPEIIQALYGARVNDPTIHRLVKLVLNMHEGMIELQDRIRDLENKVDVLNYEVDHTNDGIQEYFDGINKG